MKKAFATLCTYARCILLLALGGSILPSCSFEPLYTREEIEQMVEEANTAHLTFYIDWSQTLEPTGMTLYLFPNTGNAGIDTVPYIFHTNTIDVFETNVPNQDYHVICFNQSEKEFANLTFIFGSFDDAQVMIAADADSQNESTKVFGTQITRGFNASGTLQPRGFSSASQKSIRSKMTRGFNASGTLQPKSAIQSMSMKVNVFGLQNAVSVQGSITNLSAGYSFSNDKPINTLCDMQLRNWTFTYSNNDSLPGSIETTFGTFGLSESVVQSVAATRDGQNPDQIALIVEFHLVNGDTLITKTDLTDEVQAKYKEAEQEKEEGQTQDINVKVEVGADTEKIDPEADYEGNVTDQGGIVLPKVANGFSVGVNDWGETNVIDIEF